MSLNEIQQYRRILLTRSGTGSVAAALYQAASVTSLLTGRLTTAEIECEG